MDAARESVAEALFRMRSQVRLSREGLAKAANVSPSTVKWVEGGSTQPKASTLQQLARGLATDGLGQVREDVAAACYAELMYSAGYTTSPHTTPPPAADDQAEGLPPDIEAVCASLLETLGAERTRQIGDIVRGLRGADRGELDDVVSAWRRIVFGSPRPPSRLASCS